MTTIDPRAAREARIKEMSEYDAAVLLVQLGRIPAEESTWDDADRDLIKRTALAFRPLVAQNLNMDDSLHELERRFNVATLSRPKPSFFRRAIGPLAFLALAASVAYLEWRDVTSDRLAFNELADRIDVVKVDAMWDTYDQVQPVWNALSRLSVNINLPEARLLGDDHTMDVLHLVLDADADGDGFANRVDSCIDIPGVDWITIDWAVTTHDGQITDGINELDGCPDPRIDQDSDGVADYRDACIETVPEGLWPHDSQVIRGPKSLFPKRQGCTTDQFVNRSCSTSSWTDEANKKVKVEGCPGKRTYSCTFDGTFKECTKI